MSSLLWCWCCRSSCFGYWWTTSSSTELLKKQISNCKRRSSSNIHYCTYCRYNLMCCCSECWALNITWFSLKLRFLLISCKYLIQYNVLLQFEQCECVCRGQWMCFSINWWWSIVTTHTHTPSLHISPSVIQLKLLLIRSLHPNWSDVMVRHVAPPLLAHLCNDITRGLPMDSWDWARTRIDHCVLHWDWPLHWWGHLFLAVVSLFMRTGWLDRARQQQQPRRLTQSALFDANS